MTFKVVLFTFQFLSVVYSTQVLAKTSSQRPKVKVSEWRAEKKTLPRFEEDPAVVLKGPAGELTIGAAVLEPSPEVDQDLAGPPKGTAIWLKSGAEEKVVDLRPTLKRVIASHVFADTDGKTVYVLLEPRTDGPHESYTVLVTHDGGLSWKKAADLKRPPFKFPAASLENFYMDAKGQGKVIFKTEGGQFTMAKSPKDAEAVFVVTTTNGGRTWLYNKSPWVWNSVNVVSER